MYVGMLVHIPRHLSRTSYNNKRCQLIIRCVFCNLGRIDLAYNDVRYTVYRWGFSSFDCSFDVLISWSRKLGLHRWFYHICFHWILLQISGFVIIIIVLYTITSWLTTCVLFHQSSTIIILYRTYSLFDITYYLSACSCMPCSWYDFQYILFWFRFIDTRVVIPARRLTFTTPFVGGFWLPWILMSRSRSLELMDSPGCWSKMRSGSINHR